MLTPLLSQTRPSYLPAMKHLKSSELREKLLGSVRAPLCLFWLCSLRGSHLPFPPYPGSAPSPISSKTCHVLFEHLCCSQALPCFHLARGQLRV